MKIKFYIFFLVFGISIRGAYAACTASTGSDGTTNFNCTQTLYGSINGEYDKVTINTTEDASMTPLSGWGVYASNNNLFKFKELEITTLGYQADGIVTKNNAKVIDIDKLTITTSGVSADGINVGRESNGAKVTVGDNLYVDAQGMGVRSNTSENGLNENLLTIGKNATIISRGDGVNRDEVKIFGFTIPAEGDGYTVYAGNAITKGVGQARVVIDNNSQLTSHGKDAHVVFANRSGVIELGSTIIKAEGQNSHGIYAETGKKLINGVSSDAGGEVYLMGDTAITSVGSDKYAIYAKGKDSFVTSSNRTTGDRVASIYTIDGNLRADNQGKIDLNMTDGTRYTGNSSIDSDGIINLNIAGVASVWNMTDSSTMTNLTLTGATLNFVAPADLNDSGAFTPKTLTVKENYVGGANSVLVLNTVLGDDSSKSDKLIIEGNTSGITKVRVRNIGGLGAQTINGIEIITVEGISGGSFKEESRITAGAYDYFVRRSTLNDKNWVLTNNFDDSTEEVIRPEARSYAVNLWMANNLFNLRLHERMGETYYRDLFSGDEQSQIDNTWVRLVVGHSLMRAGDEKLRSHYSRYVFQVGTDLYRKATGNNAEYSLGVMAGYGNYSGRTTNILTNYRSDSDTHGYSLGLYATYFANKNEEKGLYLDSWLQYNHLNHKIYGDDISTEKYRSRGWSASVEAGYTIPLNKSDSLDRSIYWSIQPQAQLIYQNVKMRNHLETNGTRISSANTGNWQTRLGFKILGKSSTEQNKYLLGNRYQLFAEANWIHNTKDIGVSMDNYVVKTDGTRDIAELKVGYESYLSRDTRIWFNFAHQMGGKKYRDTRGLVGIRHTF